MQRIDLRLALALVLGTHAARESQKHPKALLQSRVAGDLAPDVADQWSQPGAPELERPAKSQLAAARSFKGFHNPRNEKLSCYVGRRRWSEVRVIKGIEACFSVIAKIS